MNVETPAGTIRIDEERISRNISKKIDAYLDGERVTFNEHVKLSDLKAFEQEVLETIQKIPYGQTVPYEYVAQRIGRNDAARAVGQACNTNPCPIVIPCHRVVAKDGLGGYGYGPEVKRFLLELEGVDVDSF